MKIKPFLCCVCVALLGLFCGCQGGQTAAPDVSGTFAFTVLKAGQADAIVLMTEHHSMVIDCGEKDDGGKVVNFLAEHNISHLDYLILTHFDKDHIGGFPELMESVRAENILVPDYEGQNSEYKKYRKSVNDHSLPVTVLTQDISFVLDDVLFEVSVPQKKVYAEGDNDFSLVVSVTHGNNTFLFAGDAEDERTAEILSDFGHEYDFLKIPHHGRYHESTPNFISVIRPTYAVICDSQKNPAEDATLRTLEDAGTLIYRTKDGDVTITSDGKSLTVRQ